jgi:hypothetical protein
MSRSEKTERGAFYEMIHLLVIILSDLSAGTMRLSDMLGINRKPNFDDFVLYLQTLEVYGAGYEEDIDPMNYKIRDIKSHSDSAIYELESVIKLYEIILMSFEMQRTNSITGDLPNNSKDIQRFMRF